MPAPLRTTNAISARRSHPRALAYLTPEPLVPLGEDGLVVVVVEVDDGLLELLELPELEGMVLLPDVSVEDEPDGEVLLPNGEVLLPDGEVLLPDGEALVLEGEVLLPDVSVEDELDGEVLLPIDELPGMVLEAPEVPDVPEEALSSFFVVVVVVVVDAPDVALGDDMLEPDEDDGSLVVVVVVVPWPNEAVAAPIREMKIANDNFFMFVPFDKDKGLFKNR